MSNYENSIEVRDLTVKYDGFTLDHVNFDVAKGSIMGFIGQNGAGKTTTIKAILNIIPVLSFVLDSTRFTPSCKLVDNLVISPKNFILMFSFLYFSSNSFIYNFLNVYFIFYGGKVY